MNNILKTTSQSEHNTPSIFVVCKTSLERGDTHGTLIDCTQDLITIQKRINEMLATSSVKNAKDWLIVKAMNFDDSPVCDLETIRDFHNLATLIVEERDLWGKFLKLRKSQSLKSSMSMFIRGFCEKHKSVEGFLNLKLFRNSNRLNHKGLELVDYLDLEQMGKDLIKSNALYAIKDDTGEFHIVENFNYKSEQTTGE